MTVGTDIKTALEEVGIAITVLRDSGNLSGEYVDIEADTSKTTLDREFYYTISAPYDTKLVGGDVLYAAATGSYYIVTNKSPEILENATIEYGCVVYRCNVSGELQRPADSVYDSNYNKTQTFTMVRSNVYGALTSVPADMDMISSRIGHVPQSELYLYIPYKYGAKSQDRYLVGSGEISEYYEISTVSQHTYNAVVCCKLTEDTRKFP